MNAILFVLLSLALADPSPAPPLEPQADSATDTQPVDAEPTAPEPAPWTPRWPGQVGPDSPYLPLEQMYAERNYAEGLEQTRAWIANNPQDAELYWIAARFIFEVGELSERDGPIDKLALYTEMLTLSETGLELSPNHPHLLFARGIANGRLGTTRGVLASLFLAKDVERDWLAVANSGFEYASLEGNERLPCDSFLSLGIFYRLVPDWWIVQALAGTRGDLDKSLSFLQKANQCSPNRINVQKELGVIQLCIGTKRKDPALLDEGRSSIQGILTLPARHEKDRIDHQHARLLLEDPAMACEYSRDGQQDLDKDKLDK